jgi:hypothetical protein
VLDGVELGGFDERPGGGLDVRGAVDVGGAFEVGGAEADDAGGADVST